jgi:hypothetical protein
VALSRRGEHLCSLSCPWRAGGSRTCGGLSVGAAERHKGGHRAVRASSAGRHADRCARRCPPRCCLLTCMCTPRRAATVPFSCTLKDALALSEGLSIGTAQRMPAGRSSSMRRSTVRPSGEGTPTPSCCGADARAPRAVPAPRACLARDCSPARRSGGKPAPARRRGALALQRPVAAHTHAALLPAAAKQMRLAARLTGGRGRAGCCSAPIGSRRRRRAGC